MYQHYVYILTNNSNNVLYIGMTNNIQRRILEHRERINVNSFSNRYNVTKLVYYETTPDRYSAKIREKQIKKWLRKWKVVLITSVNPNWNDLTDDILEG